MDEPLSEPLPAQNNQALADAGNAEAQFSLALRFANEGEVPDYLQAAEWYLKAADQSHPLAQFNLGLMYDKGQGVPHDPALSMVWIGKAANLGDAGAQYMLGMRQNRLSLAETPELALESRIEAYKWLRLAAAQGYRDSGAGCDLVARGMTHEAMVEANRRTDAFVVGSAPIRK